MKIRSGLAGLTLVFLTALASAALPPAPNPPCAGAPVPDYPRTGEAPQVTLWETKDLAPGWKPPTCTAWPAGAATIVAGLAGRFTTANGADGLLARIGAISSLTGVRYWSVTDRRWNAMFTRAAALSGPDAKKSRGDFLPAELHSGAALYFLAADNRSGRDNVSRLKVIAADSAHIVIETENASPLRWGFLTYAAPGNFQTWYFLDRAATGEWRFYSLTRVFYASSFFASVIPGKSYVNRAVAMYRYLLAQPTDREPPAAP